LCAVGNLANRLCEPEPSPCFAFVNLYVFSLAFVSYDCGNCPNQRLFAIAEPLKLVSPLKSKRYRFFRQQLTV
jgi:hypothetical protein